MKKARLVFLIVFGLLFVSMVSRVPVQAKPEADPVKFAIIFATGGLGDKSFNDAAWRGKLMAEEKYNTTIWVDYVQPKTQPEFAPYQDALSRIGYDDENGSLYELIICIGFLQTWALNDTASLYPANDYVIIDESVLNKTNPNVKGFTFREHEGSFLVGAMAGMTTKTNNLGFFGGMNVYLINKFLAGYTHGAKFINPDINISVSFAPDQTNPWLDVAGGRAVAQAFYDAVPQNDIVYAAAGLSGFGVIQEANATEGVYAIGVDSDQDYLAPGSVLCSMLKLVETAVFNSIDAKMQGKFNFDNVDLGLADGGVGISPMTYTEEEKNKPFFFERYCETKTRYEWVQNLSDQIIAGDIKVALQPGDVPSDEELAFNTTCPVIPTETDTEPETETEPEETSTTEDIESIPSSGFELISALAILCCTSVFIRRRLRK